MHRALAVSEICGLIVRALGPKDADNLNTLVALAQTCQTLSEHALDVLWEAPDAWRLAQCMPKELCVMHKQAIEPSRRAKAMEISRRIATMDISRQSEAIETSGRADQGRERYKITWVSHSLPSAGCYRLE
jgi:sarcosine oxidase gamma subunit